MSAKRNILRGFEIGARLLVACAVLALIGSAGGQTPTPTGEKYTGERLVLDAESQEWQEVLPPEPGTDAGDLQLARNALTAGRAKDARKMLRTWLQSYPDSRLGGQALLALAEAEFACENYFQAYDRYREVLDTYPPGHLTDRAYQGQLDLAVALLGTGQARPKKRKLWKIFRIHAYEEALEILMDIEARAADSQWAEKALRTRADYHYRVGEFEDAEETYARLARDYPNGPYAKLALLRSAWSAMASFPGIEFDDAKLMEAEERFLELRRQYPDYAVQQDVPAMLETIREKRAEKLYHRGRYYERVRKPGAAAFYYRQTRQNWPETTWAMQARGRLHALGFEEEAMPPEPSPPAEPPPESTP